MTRIDITITNECKYFVTVSRNGKTRKHDDVSEPSFERAALLGYQHGRVIRSDNARDHMRVIYQIEGKTK